MATPGRRVVYTPPSPLEAKEVPAKIRCTATVRGRGRRATRGSSAELVAEDEFVVVTFDAVAPQLDIIASGPASNKTLFAQHSGIFRFDTIEYQWILFPITAGELTIDDGQLAQYQAPDDLPSSVKYCLSGKCVVTVTGTGTNARADTMDTNEVEFHLEA